MPPMMPVRKERAPSPEWPVYVSVDVSLRDGVIVVGSGRVMTLGNDFIVVALDHPLSNNRGALDNDFGAFPHIGPVEVC
jgi:hypothetical protein